MRVYSHTNWLPNLVNFCRQPIAAIAAQCLRGRGGKIMKVFGEKTQFFLNTLYLFHNSFPFLHPNSHYRPVTPASAWQAGLLSLLSPKLLVTHSCKINHVFLPLKTHELKDDKHSLFDTGVLSRRLGSVGDLCSQTSTNIMVKRGRFVYANKYHG